MLQAGKCRFIHSECESFTQLRISVALTTKFLCFCLSPKRSASHMCMVSNNAAHEYSIFACNMLSFNNRHMLSNNMVTSAENWLINLARFEAFSGIHSQGCVGVLTKTV